MRAWKPEDDDKGLPPAGPTWQRTRCGLYLSSSDASPLPRQAGSSTRTAQQVDLLGRCSHPRGSARAL